MAKIKADLVTYVDDERRILGMCELPVVMGSIYNPIAIIGEDGLEELGLELEICIEDRTYEVVVKRIDHASSSGDGKPTPS